MKPGSFIAIFVLSQMLGSLNAGQGVSVSREISPADYEILYVNSPAIATPQVLEAMERVAKLKRLDGAFLLINALAFNLNPDESLESLSASEMVPAISVLNQYYDSSVLPLLFVWALETDQSWLRKRCALAVRTLGRQAEIESYSGIFSLDSIDEPKTKEFRSLLRAERIEIELFSAGREAAERVVKVVLEKKKKKQ